MGPRRGQIAQDVLGFRRRWQELEAERAGSAGGGSEPPEAMKKYEPGTVVPGRVRADGTARPDEWVCMCSAANFLDSGTFKKCESGPSPVHRATGAGECQRVRHMPEAGRSISRQSGDRTIVIEDEVPSKERLKVLEAMGRTMTELQDTEPAASLTATIGQIPAKRADARPPGAELDSALASVERAKAAVQERAKRSPRTAGEGREGQDQAADSDRGCQRGRAQIAASKGTQRTRGGGRNAASARRPCGARCHQRTGRVKASRRPAKVCTGQIEIQTTLGTIGGHIHGERRVHGPRTHTMLDLREFDVGAEKRKTVPCSRRGPDRSLVLRMATPSRDGRETDALGHQESIDN